MGKTTLVTGGSGYIGALLVKELREAQHEVRVLDSLLHGQEDIAAEQEQAGVQVIRADIRDGEARKRALGGRGRGRAPRGDRRRPGVRARPRAVRRGQRAGHTRPGGGRGRGGRRTAGVRVDVLQLRSHGRPDGADHRGGPAQPSVAVRRTEGQHGEADPRRRSGQRETDVPALRDRVRRRAAHALRPDGQRVHARTVGRPRAGSVRRAVLAPIHPRARRWAGGPHGARGARGEGRRQRLQRGALGRELPQARSGARRSASRSTAARSPTSSATRIRATTR